MAYTPPAAGSRIDAPLLEGMVGAWQSYAVTWSSSSGAAPAIGNGFLEGERMVVGGLCIVRISLQGGSTTTYGGGQMRFSLPFTAAALGQATMGYIGTAYCTDAGAAYYAGVARVLSGGNVVMPISGTTSTGASSSEWNATKPFTWGSGDALSIQVAFKPA